MKTKNKQTKLTDVTKSGGTAVVTEPADKDEKKSDPSVPVPQTKETENKKAVNKAQKAENAKNSSKKAEKDSASSENEIGNAKKERKAAKKSADKTEKKPKTVKKEEKAVKKAALADEAEQDPVENVADAEEKLREKKIRKLRAADPETLLWLSVLSGVVAIVLYLIVSTVTDFPDLYIGIAIAVLYGSAATALLIWARFTIKQYAEMQAQIYSDSAIMTTLINISDIPAVLTHDDGTVIWYNNAFQDVLHLKGTPIFKKKLEKYCPLDIPAIKDATQSPRELDRLAIAEAGNAGVPSYTSVGNVFACAPRAANGKGGVEYVIEDRRFLVKSYSALFTADNASREKRNYNLTVFEEVTELMTLKDRLESEDLVVAYIILDNLEDLARYARVDYRYAANNIEVYLKEWAAELGGVLCEYDRDKYMLLLSHEKLEECIASEFPILDKIRDEKLGDGTVSITVSMGISAKGLSLAARQENAQTALENALRRGGDQIVIKTDKGLQCLGGRSKTIQKSENVTARVNAQSIAQYVKAHSKIMIMGHKNPDCDSIGAAVGMARLVMSVASPDTSVRVIVNTANSTFLTCTAAIRDLPEYKNVFIDANAAIDSVTSDTLLIIVDANNLNIIESPDIARSLKDIIIVDHHRKTDEYAREPLLEYIEPRASSASELITEMISMLFTDKVLLTDEANILLSGIMLDTMNFTRSTGERTFSAAHYLRSLGATSEQTRTFFEDPLDLHLSEAIFFKPGNVTLYRERIAIAVNMGHNPVYDRIAAAKASEKLIATQNIEAAFALVKIGESIVISARSNGKINVQIILEELRGGGHFDSAGAQVNGQSMNDVLFMLKNAINRHVND